MVSGLVGKDALHWQGGSSLNSALLPFFLNSAQGERKQTTGALPPQTHGYLDGTWNDIVKLTTLAANPL